MGKAEPQSDPASTNVQAQRWHEFLEMAVTVSRASGGALWSIEHGQPNLLTQHQLGDQRLDEIHHLWSGHTDSLNAVIKTGQSKTFDANFEQSGKTQPLHLLLLPIVSESTVQMVLELFLPQPAELPIEEIEGSVRQLLTWATPSEAMPANDSSAVEFATWLTQIHRHLEIDKTCFAMTNETRTWSGWDRVSLFIQEGKKLKLKSVSGVDVLDPRSTTVKILEATANFFADQTEPVSSFHEPPHKAIQEYQAQTKAKHVAVIPLRRNLGTKKQELTGSLIFDCFEESGQQVRTVDDLQTAGHHITAALQHSLQYENAKKTSVHRLLRGVLSRRFAKTILAFSAFIAVTLFLCQKQTTLTITGTGFLEPARQQDVFAVANGLIEKLHVSQGEKVQAKDELITLRSPELEFEINRRNGELQTVRQQISDLEKLRTDPRRAAELQKTANELAARGEELKAVEKSLQQQLNQLAQQSAELVLLSPINGEVISWNLKSLLAEDRPVSRADRLLSIAELSGDWKAKLHVDQRDIGPVLDAYDQKKILITVVTADAPESPKAATITKIAPTITTDAISGTALVLETKVDRNSIPEIRPGTTLLFRIDCGEAPIGYVWFRRLIDRVHSWWTLL